MNILPGVKNIVHRNTYEIKALVGQCHRKLNDSLGTNRFGDKSEFTNNFLD